MKKLSLFAIVMIMVMVACNKEQDTYKESKDVSNAEKSLFVKAFDAHGDFSSKVAVNGCQGLLSMNNRGSGSSHSIGYFSLTGQQCWGNCDVNSPELTSISNGQFTLTDQEGDQLFITYTDGCYENGIDCISPNGESACRVYSGYFVVSGGTGQYSSVGGEGSLEIIFYVGNQTPTKSSDEPVGASSNSISSFVMEGSLTFPYFIESNRYER